MENTNTYTINNKEIVVERVFSDNEPDLIEVLIKYFLNLQKKEDRKD